MIVTGDDILAPMIPYECISNSLNMTDKSATILVIKVLFFEYIPHTLLIYLWKEKKLIGATAVAIVAKHFRENLTVRVVVAIQKYVADIGHRPSGARNAAETGLERDPLTPQQLRVHDVESVEKEEPVETSPVYFNQLYN